MNGELLNIHDAIEQRISWMVNYSDINFSDLQQLKLLIILFLMNYVEP